MPELLVGAAMNRYYVAVVVFWLSGGDVYLVSEPLQTQ